MAEREREEAAPSPDEPEPVEASYEGGCHCGAVRFRVRVRAHRAFACNCSICAKKGFIHLIVAAADFELLCGAESLTRYRFGTRTAEHTFCSVCGVHPFYTPRSHPDGVDVNTRCLDGDAARRFSVTPFDGRNWEASIAGLRAST